ncbi:putative membrane protein YeaQ/YmgE (transglycosylase-associated protein family) [Palleronia aestuarii]|uniref:Putative membrane protein YeaQ/YmgE (Transglycosylase-associated protein family) n=1 Tax=Palleronia aestuarii TaxID=568105 RepID=A0A2W7NH36_9RHOB|nr:GlsB/YeaQ/YmgE family stress response membrane protein [Palleronia aestuarii]PZX18773.1 putative membrane protein YeaQ/YmgE (transglycosylase-associated protein family) [Palleronia aestuarii]
MGWLAAIIVGGIAGWLAEQFMKSNMGLLMNIVLGIIGAIVFNFIFGTLLGLYAAGASFSFGYLIAGFIGACILIAIARAVRGRA